MTDEQGTKLYSLEMEMSVLGSMIIDKKAVAKAAAILDSSDFWRPAHKRIFESCVKLNGTLDLVTLKHDLDDAGFLTECGGDDYLIQIADFVPSSSNIEHYAKCVLDKAKLRAVQRVGKQLLEQIADHENSPDHALQSVEDVLKNIMRRGVSVERYFTPRKPSDLRKLPKMEWLVQNMMANRGLGMIYGPPGGGKTFVAMDLICVLAKGNFLFAKEFGVHGPYTVAYAAGEKFQGIAQRLDAAIKKNKLTPEDEDRITIYDHVPQLFDQSLEGNIRRFIEELKNDFPNGLDCLIIDTLHSATVGADENHATDVGKEIYMARLIQAALGCAIIVIHHSNKGGEEERGSSAWRGAVDMLLLVKKPVDNLLTYTLGCEKMGDAPDQFTINFLLEPVDDVDEIAVEWQGRSRPKGKNVKDEILRILKEFEGQWMTIKQVYDLNLVEGATQKQYETQLNRYFASKPENSGVNKMVKNPDAIVSKNNPCLFMFDHALIKNHQPWTAYKDSDDSPDIVPLAQEYDPFADD